MTARQTTRAFASALLLATAALNAEPSQSPTAILEGLSFPRDHEAAFVQRQHNPMLRTAQEQHGVMRITSAGEMIMQVTAPRREERILADGWVTLKRERRAQYGPGRRTVTRRLQLDPAHPSQLVLVALEALLLGDVAAVQTHFDVSPGAAADGWQLVLTPSNPVTGTKLHRVVLSGRDDRLLKIRSERDKPEHEAGLASWLEIEILHPQETGAG